MVCNLKVRRSQAAAEEASPYRLQISAKHAVGGAGGLISDELRYASLPDLFRALDDLRLPGDLLLTAQLAEDLVRAEDRWLLIASDVQIPYDVLTDAGFDLDDQSS